MRYRPASASAWKTGFGNSRAASICSAFSRTIGASWRAASSTDDGGEGEAAVTSWESSRVLESGPGVNKSSVRRRALLVYQANGRVQSRFRRRVVVFIMNDT